MLFPRYRGSVTSKMWRIWYKRSRFSHIWYKRSRFSHISYFLVFLMLIIGQSNDTEETALGIRAQWWTNNSFPSTLDDLDLSDFFEVKNIQDRGEYYERPENVTGVIVSSLKKLAAVAAWRNKEHKGPWQIYGEQESGTIAFHYLGDSDVVFVGWV